MRSIPPLTVTGGRLRSADPTRFRTRPRQQESEAKGDMAPSGPFGQHYDKPERPKASACGTCGSTNIAGSEEKDGHWYVFCVICDELREAAA